VVLIASFKNNLKIICKKLGYENNPPYIYIRLERTTFFNSQKTTIMTASTNLVTYANLSMMKLHILGMCKLSTSSVKNLEQANLMSSMFDYQTEQIETEVFAYLYENLEIRMQMRLKELGF